MDGSPPDHVGRFESDAVEAQLRDRSAGSYYGRWRTADGRKLNRRVGRIREPGSADGLTRAQAERAFRKLQDAEELNPSRRRDAPAVTLSAAAGSLRRAKALEGARKSYLENLESMQRVHLDAGIGSLALQAVRQHTLRLSSRACCERVARRRGLAI
jgi:hypothetical protein